MPPSESDVRFPDWYGRAGMSAFFCSDAFEYPFDSDRLQGVFPFGRKSIPSNKKKHFVQPACAGGIAKLRLNAPDWP